MKRKYFWFLTVLLGSFFFSSCTLFVDEYDDLPRHTGEGYDVPVHIDNENYDLTYQLNENVTQLDQDNRIGYIKAIESDITDIDHILYYDLLTPEDKLPVVGEVLVSGDTEKFEYGLGVVVDSVIKETNYYRVVTTNAALDEIYKDLKLRTILTFEDDRPFMPNNIESEATRSGGEEEQINEDFGIPLDFKLANIKLSSTEEMLEANLSLTLKARFSVEVDIDLWDKKFNFTPRIAPLEAGEKTMSIDLNGKINLVDIKNKRIAGKDDLLNGKVEITIPCRPPIVLVPVLGLELLMDANMTGEVNVGLGLNGSSSLPLGTDGEKKRKASTDTMTPELDITSPISGELAFKVRLTLGMGLYTSFFSIRVEPQVNFTTTLDELNISSSSINNFEVKIEKNPKVTSSLRFEGALSLLFKKKDFDLFKKKSEAERKNSIAKDHLKLQSPWDQVLDEIWVDDDNSIGLRIGPIGFDIWKGSDYFFPKVKDESIKLVRSFDSKGNLVFNGEYELETTGIFGKLNNNNFRPYMFVYNGSGKVVNKYKALGATKIESQKKYTFGLTGLEEDVPYIAKPNIWQDFTGGMWRFEDRGIPFCTTTPVLAISDVVVDEANEFEWDINGEATATYIFKFHTITFVKGAEHIESWGLWTSDVEDEYGEGRKNNFYKATNIYDGRYMHFWTLTSDRPSHNRISYIPSVKLKEALQGKNEKDFSIFSGYLDYKAGIGYFGQLFLAKPAFIPVKHRWNMKGNTGKVALQLDSVLLDGRRVQ